MMKKNVAITMLIIVFLAAFIPFASSSPDGLETVVSSIGIQPQNLWEGFMTDYSVTALGNGYISTLLAGIFGVLFVLLATLALGKAITKRSHTTSQKL
jgi:hypothetical protein